jgi:prevent-host-death family protein
VDIMTDKWLNVIMTETLGVAETKRRFAELLDRVLDGERVVVTRRGRPVAVLVPASDAAARQPSTHLGLAAFAGAMSDWPEFEQVMAEVVASRAAAGARPAPSFE